MEKTYNYLKNHFNDRFFDGNLEAHEAKRKALYAINRQIPRKPEVVKNEIVCPICNTLIGSHPFCRYCGQRIDFLGFIKGKYE